MYITNRFNKITAKGDVIIKEGPKSLLQGERFFYEAIPSTIADLFPKFEGSFESQPNLILYMELINGTNLSELFIAKKLTRSHIKALDKILTRIHNVDIQYTLCPQDIAEFYKEKFLTRLAVYSFQESEHIKDIILTFLKSYAHRINIKSVIHGDFWLSNVIITPSGSYKLVDMRGKIGNSLTLAGDPNYDYAKLYQSLLGYDYILYDDIENYDETYKNSLIDYYKTLLTEKNLSFEDIHLLTIILILGNLPFIELEQKKQQVLEWVLALIAKK